MTYICPVCGVEASRPGDCDMCKVELEKVCDACGEAESRCVCGSGGEEESENKKEDD